MESRLENLLHRRMFFFIISLLILVFIADFIRNKFYFKSTYEELKTSYNIFLKYIDRYYVINIKYTILGAIIYIIGTIILFLFIRYLFLGQINILLRTDTSIIIIDNWNLLKFVLKYVFFLLTIYLYKILLQILFFKEIIKLRIYLQKYRILFVVNRYCRLNFGEYICRLIWMLSYRIATQTFKDDLFEGEYELWKDTALDYVEQDYLYIYNNIYVKKIIKFLMKISLQLPIIALLFYFNAKLFKFLARHLSKGLFKFIPYTLIFSCLLYDVYYRKLYFVYFSTFIYFIYYIIKNFRKVEESFDIINIIQLKDYFYENEFPYLSQRFYIINKDIYSINKKSKQNLEMLSVFESAKEIGRAHV